MNPPTCPVCGKRMPHRWAINQNYCCSHTCQQILAGKLRPVSIAEVLGGKR